MWSKYDFYMLICYFLYYIRNISNNNPYVWYNIYRQSLHKEGARDVERRLAIGFNFQYGLNLMYEISIF